VAKVAVARSARLCGPNAAIQVLAVIRSARELPHKKSIVWQGVKPVVVATIGQNHDHSLFVTGLWCASADGRHDEVSRCG
jgi:hypothetical protein